MQDVWRGRLPRLGVVNPFELKKFEEFFQRFLRCSSRSIS